MQGPEVGVRTVGLKSIRNQGARSTRGKVRSNKEGRWRSFENHGKDFGLCLQYNGKLLEHFEKGNT